MTTWHVVFLEIKVPGEGEAEMGTSRPHLALWASGSNLK